MSMLWSGNMSDRKIDVREKDNREKDVVVPFFKVTSTADDVVRDVTMLAVVQ